MLRIAVLSDSTDFFNLIKPLLTSEGYEVHLCPLAADDLSESLADNNAELIVIDFFTSPGAAKEALQAAKRDDCIPSAHVIAVLDKAPSDDFDFKLGIDDFIFKGSLESELSLRVELFLWKHKKIDSSGRIVVSEFVIDTANYEATFKGEKLTLTFKEFELLKFLITHRGRVYSRDALLNQVWGYNYYGGTRTVDVHVRRLRSKIGIDIDKYLKTVRNVGYKFEV